MKFMSLKRWFCSAVLLALGSQGSWADIAISGTVRAPAGAGRVYVELEATGTDLDSGQPVNAWNSTDTNGNYVLTLRGTANWSGTVTPSSSWGRDYAFTPTSRVYAGLTANLSGADYLATPPPRRIEGRIETTTWQALAGVVLSATGGHSATTDVSGIYAFVVPHDWSGRVTPRRAGYSFTPSYKTYPPAWAYVDGSFTASQIMVRISGYFRSASGAAMRGATIRDGRRLYSATTTRTGSYSLRVPHGWSGVLTARLPGCVISPASRTYSNVTASKSNQNFRANFQTISGYVRDAYGNSPLGVMLRANNGGATVTSSRSGAYSLRVPPGWTGTVKPDSSGRYQFRPTRRTYRSLRANPRNQNFTVPPYDRYAKAVGFKPLRGGARTLTLGLGRSYNVAGLYGWKNFMGHENWKLVWAIDGREFQRINDNNQVNFSFVPTLEREISVLTPKYVPNQLGTHTIRFYVDYRAPGALVDNNQANDSVTATFTVVQTPPPNLLVKPAERVLMHNAGRTSFVITNTEPGTRMRYTVSESVSWLRITSGARGVNGGRVYIAYDRNTSSRDRTGIIRVAASGTSGNPTYVKVVQYRNFLARSGKQVQPAPLTSPDNRPVAQPSAWSRSGMSAWKATPELADGNTRTVWQGRPAESPWMVALDFGHTVPREQPDILFADEPWDNVGMMGTCDLLEWFDLRLTTNWPIPCRALFLHFPDAGSDRAPAIREIQWPAAESQAEP
jgi:hypothetical protein